MIHLQYDFGPFCNSAIPFLNENDTSGTHVEPEKIIV